MVSITTNFWIWTKNHLVWTCRIICRRWLVTWSHCCWWKCIKRCIVAATVLLAACLTMAPMIMTILWSGFWPSGSWLFSMVTPITFRHGTNYEQCDKWWLKKMRRRKCKSRRIDLQGLCVVMWIVNMFFLQGLNFKCDIKWLREVCPVLCKRPSLKPEILEQKTERKINIIIPKSIGYLPTHFLFQTFYNLGKCLQVHNRYKQIGE